MVLLLGLLGACDHIARIDGVTRTVALAWNDGLYLPPMATSVYAYEKVGGLQDLEAFCRFTVPAAHVESAVDYVTTECEKDMKTRYTFERSSDLSSTHHWPHWAKTTMSWWEPDSIATGFYKGTSESYGVRVWADIRSGTIFVYQSD